VYNPMTMRITTSDEVPAGGTAAAVLEGGALACPSASPHLPVLGGRWNPRSRAKLGTVGG
jgi:hypothetical protein